jgi:hypothetical protein
MRSPEWQDVDLRGQVVRLRPELFEIDGREWRNWQTR